MAGEFVPDGHKYGLRWAAPWGAAQNTYGGDTKNLFFSQVVFVASVEGVPVTLGLDGWYMEGRDTAPAANYTGYISASAADSTHVLYFRLAYDPETKQACTFNSTYVPDLPAQSLADNQVLVRLTFNLAKAKYQNVSGGAYPYLFAGKTYGSGYFRIWTNASQTGSGWDMCFEFSDAKEVKVHSFSMGIATQSGSQIGAAAGASLYLDDQELSLVGGLVGNTYGDTNVRTIQLIELGAFTYKNNMGGVYDLGSMIMTRAQLRALEARITLLEEAQNGG